MHLLGLRHGETLLLVTCKAIDNDIGKLLPEYAKVRGGLFPFPVCSALFLWNAARIVLCFSLKNRFAASPLSPGYFLFPFFPQHCSLQ
jgi:hypothetical protein